MSFARRRPMAVVFNEPRQPVLNLIFMAQVAFGEPEQQRCFAYTSRVVNVAGQIGSCIASSQRSRIALDELDLAAMVKHLRVSADFKFAPPDGVHNPCPTMVVRRPVKSVRFCVGKQHESRIRVTI
jgi:hypothetical protein